MYSVKPGRGPSLMAAFGGVIAALFGVGWIIGAIRMGAPLLFPYFGVLFVLVALGGVAYSLFNAFAGNRMSDLDITDDGEESDPVARALGRENGGMTRRALFRRHERKTSSASYQGSPCPYCAATVVRGAKQCSRCGKDL